MKKLLDLYCGAGGAAVGYYRAGFNILGVDHKEQPNYPFEMLQADITTLDLKDIAEDFDVIHASPPCQAYSWATKGWRNKGKVYPDLLGITRDLILKTGKPYIIENVKGAPLDKPVMLCGTMFKGLRVIRHRYFESNLWLYPPCKCDHKGSVNRGDYVSIYAGGRWIGKYGFKNAQERIDKDNEIKARVRKKYLDPNGKPKEVYLKRFVTPVDGAGVGDSWRWPAEKREAYRELYREHIHDKYLTPEGELKPRYCSVAGHGCNGSARYLDWCDAMGIHWMCHHKTLAKNKYDLTQAIPPAYTQWLGSIISKVNP